MNKVKLFYHPIFWLIVYLFLHLLIRLSLSQTLQVDDREQVFVAQNLLLGYPMPQPPLYSWLSWGMFQLFGISLLSLTMLKYAIIALTFWVTWLVSGQLFQHLQTRYIATFAYLLIPSFAWHMHQGFTHTILLGLGIILSLHALLSLRENPNIKNYLYLGGALGIGLMGKYSFLLFMLPILAAALTLNTYRTLILDRKFLLTLGMFALVIAPHAYWLSQHYQEIFYLADDRLKISSENLILERLQSVGKFAGSAIAFVTPLILIFIISSWRRLFNQDKLLTKDDNTLLLSRFYWIIIVSVLVLAIFVSMPHFKVRWFHPLMMIFPLWMLLRIERQTPLSSSVVKWFYTLALVLTVLVISVRIAQMTIGPELGKYGRLNKPMIETLDKLPAELTNNTIMKTRDYFIGPHLLLNYPNHIIIGSKQFNTAQPDRTNQCLWLWDDDGDYIEPNIQNTLTTGQLVTQVAEFKYTLFYTLSPAVECLD